MEEELTRADLAAHKDVVSPMMLQYLETKEQYSDCILFYRLGDFYEMFFEDAQIASRELELTLTGKNCGLPKRAPMCGVPFHAAEGYLNRLVEKGYKVAICEQMEDPKQAKGLVKRDVIRIVTPGTNVIEGTLDEGKNRFLMSIVREGLYYGISTVDLTTGEYYVTQVSDGKGVSDEIQKFQPSEVLCDKAETRWNVPLDELAFRMNFTVSKLDSWYFERQNCEKALFDHFHLSDTAGLGLSDTPAGTLAAGSVLLYLEETQKSSLEHLTRLSPYTTQKYMLLDATARRNLELTETLREKNKKGSLLWVLDQTKTAMGARLLRSFLEQPLIQKERINARLDAVQELVETPLLREELREYLGPIYDLERLIGRVSLHTVNARDMIALKTSLSTLPAIRMLVGECKGTLLREIFQDLDPLEDVCSRIEACLQDDPPISLRDGNLIKAGYSSQVDELRSAGTDGKKWLTQIEEKEREATGIKNLRIRYNKVFGYYLEVTNSFLDLVPDTWTRKQTLTGAERYITPELKDLENKILGAEDRLRTLEYDLFAELRDFVAGEIVRIQTTAKAVAALDVFASLAQVASARHYVRPILNENGEIHIRDGRHPVVERMIPHDQFVANDADLDEKQNRIAILTGPNMAGKSTYMRQTALIVLLAQIGSFVPASYADIGIVDRIFTRVGASDDLASGQSTFMVEMTEVSNILRNATRDSLLVLDEIGRGTSTFDGLSIAWAVVEYIANPNRLGAKALFATHYHELTELEGKLPGVRNYNIAVKEQGDHIVFLRKICRGGADRSYGIQVARLAGVPEPVLRRARDIARRLEKESLSHNSKKASKQIAEQLSLFDTENTADFSYQSPTVSKEEEDVLRQIRECKVEEMTPLHALSMLADLQRELCSG